MPTAKDEIEKSIINKFIRAGRKAGFTIHSCTKNTESHFDFTLVIGSQETVYVDLKEIIIPNKNNSPYKRTNKQINDEEYSNYIIKLIKECSEKYRSKSKTPIHLLLYITDWKFNPSNTVIALVQHALLKQDLMFEYVFFLDIVADDYEELRLLFPSKKSRWIGFDPNNYKNSTTYNLNPSKWELSSNK